MSAHNVFPGRNLAEQVCVTGSSSQDLLVGVATGIVEHGVVLTRVGAQLVATLARACDFDARSPTSLLTCHRRDFGGDMFQRVKFLSGTMQTAQRSVFRTV